MSVFFHLKPSGFDQSSGLPCDETASTVFPLEATLVGITAAHLRFLPWALGSMHRWSQLISLGFAMAGFALCLWPRGGREGDFSPVGRLRRFPVFWAGLVLLLYIAAQGLNPAWRYTRNTDSWWLEPVAYVAWLPAGMQAPFAQSSPWSALIVFASLWLLVCSVWTGLTRRRSYRQLFTVLIGNAVLLALLGVLQQLTETKRIFWSYLPSSGGSFVSSFIYRNHAGPYLNLMLAAAAGLAFWHHERAVRHHRTSSPAFIFVFIAAFVAVMVLFSYSRGSIGMLLVFMLVIMCSMTARRFFGHARSSRRRIDLLILIAVFSGFLGIFLVSLRSEKLWQRFAQIDSDPVSTASFRSLARQAAGEMLRDRWVFGWGAGCFRYGFPLYAQKYPEIYNPGTGKLLFWEHAHDDLLEFPIEFGVVGLIPLVVALGCAVWQLARRRFWRNSVSLSLVLACALTVCHSWLDFVLQNPAVLLTWSVLLVAAVRWLELDQPGSSRLAARFSRSGQIGPTTKL